MFRTKKDVDRHVQDVMRKLKSENEVSPPFLYQCVCVIDFIM